MKQSEAEKTCMDAIWKLQSKKSFLFRSKKCEETFYKKTYIVAKTKNVTSN